MQTFYKTLPIFKTI